MPRQRNRGKIALLGISGSPRKGGLTDTLLDKALEGARSAGGIVEKITLNDLDIKPCRECGDCTETGACAVHDDMHLIHEKFRSAGAVIISSPIFFASVSAQLKAMIDRFQTVWVSKYVLKKPVYDKRRKGIFLCTAGQNKIEYFENAKEIIKTFFATADIDYAGELFLGGYDPKAGNTAEKNAAFEKAFELGLKICKPSL